MLNVVHSSTSLNPKPEGSVACFILSSYLKITFMEINAVDKTLLFHNLTFVYNRQKMEVIETPLIPLALVITEQQ